MTEAPPLRRRAPLHTQHVAAGRCAVVALIDDTVVGWCDISRLSQPRSGTAHTSGMGVVAAQRRGIGRALLDATLARAERPVSRVELRVGTTTCRRSGLRAPGFEVVNPVAAIERTGPASDA